MKSIAPRDAEGQAPGRAPTMVRNESGAWHRKGSSANSPLNPALEALRKIANAPLGPQLLEPVVEEAQPPNSATVEPPTATPRLADLLDEIVFLIDRHVQLPTRHLSMLIAVWIVETYAFEHFRYCGYLALRSATPRCGKSLVMRLLSQLCREAPPVTSTPTPAVLFRSTRPVLLLDEVDKLRNADKEKYGEVLSVLNCGFEVGGVVDRCNKVSLKVESFPVYGPKALAGIEGIADTLADRTFHVQMERSPQRMPRLVLRKMNDLFDQVRLGLQSWTEEHETEMVDMYDGLPDALNCLEQFDDRFQDIAEPLIVLGTLADAERPDGPPVLPRLLEGLKAAAGRREPSSRETQLLAFLDMVEPHVPAHEGGEVFMPSVMILEMSKDREELSRIETGRALAGFLRNFDLRPKAQSGKTRGYSISRKWFTRWGERYGRA
ncbi:MAG: hypothetical protein L0H94_01975 [Nitrospira sp.]|nr:hypothetical protein [Nitrospira sp.]